MNLAILVTGKSPTTGFSILAIQTLPDLEVQSKGQIFPRFHYKKQREEQNGGIFENLVEVPDGYELQDNILDEALGAFQKHYKDNAISKDDIFFYVYGLLHSLGYRKKYANDLRKEFPHIPYAPDFWSFRNAGEELCWLHIGYEELEGYDLKMETSNEFEPNNDEHYKFTKPKWLDNKKRTAIKVNDYITLKNIPLEADEYIINGKSALHWIVSCYRIKTHDVSEITNNPNDLFDNPRDFIQLIKQVCQVAVETIGIVNALPEKFE